MTRQRKELVDLQVYRNRAQQINLLLTDRTVLRLDNQLRWPVHQQYWQPVWGQLAQRLRREVGA